MSYEVTYTISNATSHVQNYRSYLCRLEDLLTDLIRCCELSEEFGRRLHEFETSKMCYLPVFALILKPAHRLVYYEIVLSSELRYCHPSVCLSV